MVAAIAEQLRGVGHDEDPITEVRGTNGRRRYAVPLRIVPALGQVPEDSSEPSPIASRKESWHVLHEDVTGS
jgi:hypothetical protein